MAVLITGVGYLGAALVARLLRAGETVIGLDNGFATQPVALAALARTGDFRLVEGSVASPRAVSRAFAAARIRTVYHLAAQASAHPRAAPPRYTEQTNLSGPRVVFDAALRHDVERVVYASSLRVYGHALPAHVTEEAPYGPQQDLAHLSHIYGEKLLELYARRGAWRAAAVRLAVVYGVGPVMKTDPRFMTVPNKFCRQAARGEVLEVYAGAAVPTGFIHLDDATAALQAAAVAAWARPFQAANAAGEVCTVPRLARLVARAAAERGLVVPLCGAAEPSPAALPAVETRLAAHGWRPERTLAAALGSIVDYFRAEAGS